MTVLDDIAKKCYSLKDSVADHSTESLKRLFVKEFGQSQISSLKDVLVSDRESYLALFDAFDKAQSEDLESRQDLSKKEREIVSDLFTNGVTKVKGLIPREHIDRSISVLNVIHNSVDANKRFRSGYILPGGAHHPSGPNDGQVRVQSKTWGSHLAGAREIANMQSMINIFAGYNSLREYEISRSTMEWIYPSPINHNGWHRDMVMHRMKAMVLLKDCGYDSAPFLYAKKSHRTTTEFDKQHLFDRFCLPGSSKQGKRETWTSGRQTWPEYALENPKKHCGYVGDTSAPNDLSLEARKSGVVTISGSEYDMFVGVGKAGDVIFFDSCGLHSGSKALKETRRNISFSGFKHLSPKNVFFNLVQRLV